MTDYLVRVPSPIGRLELTADAAGVVSLTIECDGELPHDSVRERPNEMLTVAGTQLEEYFAGSRRSFEVPLSVGGTAFQRSIWSELARVGWGQFTTYGALGAAVGRPTAGRAVGGAIGANRLPLLIPCHRVLGSDGRVTGYSAGQGISTKLWLLEHEGITLAA